MKKLLSGRVLWRIVCLVMASVCAGMGCVLWQGTVPERDKIQLICEDGLAVARAEQICEAEKEKADGVSFTAWREYRDCVVYSASGGRVAYTDVVELCGSSEQIFSTGRVLHREDVEGCLVGEALAEQLFGDRRAEGLTLEYDGRTLVVRGVLREPGMLLTVQAVDTDAVFDRMTLSAEPGSTRSRTAQRFVDAYGLDADRICYEVFGMEYLTECIPGKWSDFAGWRQSLSHMGEDIRRAFSVEKSRTELLYLRDVGWSLMLWSMGVLLSAVGVFAEKNSGTG